MGKEDGLQQPGAPSCGLAAPAWRQGSTQAPGLGERVPLASLFPNTPCKLGLGLPPFPTRNSLALLLPALGQRTIVNRFSPPISGLRALGLCPTLHSAQPHPP